jgi:hypothetical protein
MLRNMLFYTELGSHCNIFDPLVSAEISDLVFLAAVSSWSVFLLVCFVILLDLSPCFQLPLLFLFAAHLEWAIATW